MAAVPQHRNDRRWGRGLRLCVNQNGDRMDADTLGRQVHQINQLTVIASDGYKEFVSDLQRGIRDDLYERPTKATPEYFIGKILRSGGSEVTVSEKQGRDIYRYLIKSDYIDENDHVTDQYRADFANGVLAPVPESCKDISEGIHTSVYKGYKQDKIEMRGDRAEMSDFPLYLNTVAGGLDCRDQTIGGFSFVVKIYALPVVEIIG